MRSLILPLLLIGSAACAQHEDMRFFVGTWDFRIWAPGNSSDKADLNGTWYLENGLDSALALVGRVVLNDGANAQGGVFTRELIAYDAYKRMYSRTIVTNTGNYYSFFSTGWKDDKLTWSGVQHSAVDEVELREEIERTGPDSFKAVFYRNNGGTWVVQSTEKLVRLKG